MKERNKVKIALIAMILIVNSIMIKTMKLHIENETTLNYIVSGLLFIIVLLISLLVYTSYSYYYKLKLQEYKSRLRRVNTKIQSKEIQVKKISSTINSDAPTMEFIQELEDKIGTLDCELIRLKIERFTLLKFINKDNRGV